MANTPSSPQPGPIEASVKRVVRGFRLFFDRRVPIGPKLLIVFLSGVMWLVPDFPGPFDDIGVSLALLALLEEFSPRDVVEEYRNR